MRRFGYFPPLRVSHDDSGKENPMLICALAIKTVTTIGINDNFQEQDRFEIESCPRGQFAFLRDDAWANLKKKKLLSAYSDLKQRICKGEIKWREETEWNRTSL